MASAYRQQISPRSRTAITDNSGHWSTGAPTVADFSSYSPATVLMFALSSFGTAFALVPILLPHSMWLISEEIYALLRTFLSIVVTVICLSLVHYKRKAIKLGHWPGVDRGNATVELGADTTSWIPIPYLNETLDKQAKYMLATIIIFGICSLASSVLQTLAEPKSFIRDTLHCLFDIISLCSQMIFFYYYIFGRLPNIRGLHYAIALLIGIKLCTWIAVSVAPLWASDERAPHFHMNGSVPMYNTSNTTESNTCGPVFEFFDEVFETFYTEFHTVAVGVLFYIWHSMEKFDGPPSLSRGISAQNETTPLLGDYQPENELDQSSEIRRRKQNKVIIIFVSVTLAIAYDIICILTAKDFFTPAGNIYIYRLITLIYYTVFNIFAFIELYTIRSNPDTTSPVFNSSEYILLFTACSESMYYFLRGVAAIGSFMRNDNMAADQITFGRLFEEVVPITDLMAGVFLLYSFIAITNCWIQTLLLLAVRRKKQVPEHVKNVLILFAGMNFAEWLQNAILLGIAKKDTVPRFNPVMDDFYGAEKVQILVLILLPTMILFRFHSAIVSIELAHE